MKQQQRKLLESIEQNYNNESFLPQETQSQGLYVSQSSTQQQIFLEKLINIYVLRKKQYNKIDQQRVQNIINENSGSFTDLLLGLRYMSYCMQNKVQVSYDKFGMLKLLTNWMDVYERIKVSPKVNLSHAVFSAIQPENHTLSTAQQLIVYLNYIAVDLQSILERPSIIPNKNANQSISQIQVNPTQVQYIYDHLDVEDLLNFINNIVPKTLFNIVIPEHFISGRPMTSTNPADQRQRDFLYSSKSLQYFAKQKNHYQHLLKLIIFTLLKFQLSQTQQKTFMTIGFKYFYIFNRQKLQQPFTIFVKIFEKITDAVKFALSDQFILFFKVINKLGHAKFISFLRQKYDWIKELLNKIDPNAIVGHPKDNINAFHGLNIMEHIHLAPGAVTQRYIQILQPYSLFYFYAGIKNLDINIRLFYMGPFTASIQKKQLLINKQKCQLQFKGNIIAIQKGIYMFEFDNSYSWIKGKALLYQTTVLTPIQITKNSVQRQKFLPVLFNKFGMNQCSEGSTIDASSLYLNQQMQITASKLQNRNLQNEGENKIFIEGSSQRSKVNIQYFSQNKVFNLKTMSNGKIYEYQTENPQLFKAKASEIIQNKKQVDSDWFINGEVKLENLQLLSKWCLDPTNYDIFKQVMKEENVQEGKIENKNDRTLNQTTPVEQIQDQVQEKTNIIAKETNESSIQQTNNLVPEQKTHEISQQSQQIVQIKSAALNQQEQKADQVKSKGYLEQCEKIQAQKINQEQNSNEFTK